MSDQKNKRGIVLPALVVLLAALGLGVYFLGGDGADGEQTRADTASGRTDDAPARRIDGDPLAKGDPDAPVVLVNYSDFQCPYCGRFARETEPKLVRKYVDKGVLRMEWRDFPYFGDDSDKAAMAGRAAADQGRFWEFHDAFYADQPKMNSGQMTDEFLGGIASGIGIDPDRFLAAIENEQFKAEIERDFSEGHSLGISGTPAFMINGQPISGAQPIKVFAKAIEQAASEAG